DEEDRVARTLMHDDVPPDSNFVAVESGAQIGDQLEAEVVVPTAVADSMGLSPAASRWGSPQAVRRVLALATRRAELPHGRLADRIPSSGHNHCAQDLSVQTQAHP